MLTGKSLSDCFTCFVLDSNSRENLWSRSRFSGLFAARGRKLRLLNRVCHQPVWVLLSSLDMLEPDSILVRFPFRLGPADVGYPLANESDHERILALDFVRIDSEKLRDPVGHDLLYLLPGDGLESA